MKTRKTIPVILAAIILVSGGCLFEPRVPETPGGGGEPWIIPSSAKDVFVNLATGFQTAANSNYERSLDDAFVFIPLVQDWPDFVSWDKSDEVDFLTRLKGDYTGERAIQFGDENTNFDREIVEVGRAEYEGKYTISLDPGDGSDAEIFAGRAIFIIEKGSTGWALISWEDVDILDAQYSTSSYLRRTFQ